MGCSEKNPNKGVEDMEFPRVMKKTMWKLQRSIKREVEFPGMIKKKSC